MCRATYRVRDCGRAIGVLVQEVTLEEEQEWQPTAWLPSADKVASTSLAEELERGQVSLWPGKLCQTRATRLLLPTVVTYQQKEKKRKKLRKQQKLLTSIKEK